MVLISKNDCIFVFKTAEAPNNIFNLLITNFNLISPNNFIKHRLPIRSIVILNCV